MSGAARGGCERKVYARSDKQYIKQYEEETNLMCTILLDASGSMGYGDGEVSKFDYAACLAAALTYLMIQQRDQVGLAVFGDDVRARLPARNSPGHMMNVLRLLEDSEPTGTTARTPFRSRTTTR